jgi:hypothetical protein
VGVRDNPALLRVLGEQEHIKSIGAAKKALHVAQTNYARARSSQSGKVNLPKTTDEWESFTQDEKRMLLAGAIDSVWVRRTGRTGTAPPIETRVHIFWRGQGPTDLPRPGARELGIRSLVWPDDVPVDAGVATA